MKTYIRPPGAMLPASFHVRHVEEARERFGRMYGKVELDPVDPERFEWRVSLATMAHPTLALDPAAASPVAVISGATKGGIALRFTPTSYVVTSVIQGAGQAGWHRARADISEKSGAAVFTSAAPYTWRLADDVRTATVRIDPAFLQAELQALTGETVPRPPQFSLATPIETAAGAALRRLCVFLANEVEQGSALFQVPTLTAPLAEAVVRALLFTYAHDHAHLLRRPAPSAGLGAVRKVEEYVDAAGPRPVSVRELAALTDASGLSIDTAFRAHRGTNLDAALATRARRAAKPPAALADLSPREREVCVRIARGHLNKQIAADLGISESTVKTYRGRVMATLGVDSAIALGRVLERLRLDGKSSE